ncbi:MAG: helix-hairpin-helix domain-containing protein [Planctomycetota bacterium]
MADTAIRYVVGDATAPLSDGTEGTRIIVHICNDIGGWGRGFVMALSKRWPEPEREYRKWYAEREHNNFGLGEVLFVPVEDDTVVANLVGQHHIRSRTADGQKPIRYDAVRRGLQAVANFAAEQPAGVPVSVHMPRIGCGLAGGRWEEIEPIIRETLLQAGLPVTVYDLAAMSDADCIKALQELPGVDAALASHLLRLGIRQVGDLRHATPQELYDRLSALTGTRHDPAVLGIFRCAVYVASHDEHDPALLDPRSWADRADPE